MADDHVRVDTDGTGKRIDNESFTRGLDTIYRQRVALGGEADAEQVKVTNADPGASDYAVVVRNVPSGTQAVSAASLPLPSGAASSANQNTEIGHLATLAGAVAGTEVQVDVLTMPTTTVTGTVTANAGTGPFPVSDNAGSLTVDSPQLPAALVGGRLDVVVGAALPAGAANIGDVDVLTLPATPAGDNAIGRVKITDGTDVADVLDLTNSNPVAVAIVDGAGTQITSFGGGTQYTEADTDTTITGTAVLWEDTSDTLRAVSAAKPLPVNVVAGSAAGTEYTEGDTDATIAGAAMLMEGAANTLVPVQGTVADGVLVNLGANNDVTVTGTVTANLAAGVNNIGDVDVLSVIPGTGATALGKAIGDTVGGTDTGVAALVVQDTTLATQVTSDDDYVALRVTDRGALWAKLDSQGQQTMANSIPVVIASNQGAVPVSQSGTWNVADISGSVSLPTGASTLAEQQTHTTHLATIAGDTTDIEAAVELIDDTVATLGTTTYSEATTKGLIIGAVRRDADTTLVDTTNEVSPLQVDANGRLKVEAFSGEPLPVTLTSTTVTGTVTVDSELPAAETPADNLTNATAAPRVNSLGYVFDGSAWDRALGNSTDGTLVNLGTNNDVTVTSGTITLAASTGTQEVVGDVAEDQPLAGNPVRSGWRASTAVPAAMSGDGDIVTPWANRSGAPVVTTAPHVGLNSDPWNLVHEAVQQTTTQTSVVVITGGASAKIVVTKLQIQTFGTNAGDLILYFAASGAYSRGTSRAIFDGTFKPSATLAPGVVMDGPFIAGANSDDVMITTTNNLNFTVSLWYYEVT